MVSPSGRGRPSGRSRTGRPGHPPPGAAPTCRRTRSSSPRSTCRPPPAGTPLAELTVTRVAAFRSRELTTKGVQIFRRAATADGADRSGLTR